MKLDKVRDTYPILDEWKALVREPLLFESWSTRTVISSEHLLCQQTESVIFRALEMSSSALITVWLSKQVEEAAENPAATPMLSVTI
jgi:hypothetical protein